MTIIYRLSIVTLLGLGMAAYMAAGCGGSAPAAASNTASSSASAAPDKDGDGVADSKDNCPDVKNADQADTDKDGKGDVCDTATSGSDSNSDAATNSESSDSSTATNSNNDGDGTAGGGAAVVDNDKDGVVDASDNCPNIANATQANQDFDALGDACDDDQDGDTVANVTDNCATTANATQSNTDGDSQGDACDTDDDNDGVADTTDNCPLLANPSQVDNASPMSSVTADGIGDACQWTEVMILENDVVSNYPQPVKGVYGFHKVPFGSEGKTKTTIYAVGNSTFASHMVDIPLMYRGDYAGIVAGSTHLTDIWGSALVDSTIDNLYIIGSSSTVIHYSATLSKSTQLAAPNDVIGVPSGGSLNAVWGSGENDVYIVGTTAAFAGMILHSTGDDTWTQIATPAPFAYQIFYAVFGFDASNVFVAGKGNVILYYNGTEWVGSESDLPSNTFVARLWGTSPNDLYAIEYHNESGKFVYNIVHSANFGLNWTTLNASAFASTGVYPTDVWGYVSGGKTIVYFPMSDGTYKLWNGTTLSDGSFGRSFLPNRMFGSPDGKDITVVGESGTTGVVLHIGSMNDAS